MAGGASLTNMTAEAHPSQPNYFALYAGSTFGTTDDDSYSLPDPTLYTVLKNGGYSFTGYVDEGGIGSDFNHDPWVSFPESRTVQTDFTSFPSLFANGNYSSLPTVSYVIPSVSNDMHSGTIAQGDTWLQQNLSAYAQWAVNNNSLLIVTWDENDNSTSEAASNQIPTLLYGANVVPGNYSTAYNHYNLLSTITASLGLTAPNSAATAAPVQVFGTAAAGAAALAVDQDGVAESPALTISSNSLTVQAGGSVSLGITATPVDSDDQLSLSISGLPSYEFDHGSGRKHRHEQPSIQRNLHLDRYRGRLHDRPTAHRANAVVELYGHRPSGCDAHGDREQHNFGRNRDIGVTDHGGDRSAGAFAR